MRVKVADASAIAVLVLGEPEAIARRLVYARLVAQALLRFELANAYLIKSRRHPDQQPELTAVLRLRGRLAVEEVAVDHDGTIELEATTGLTAYDASYLWLARKIGAELVTIDKTGQSRSGLSTFPGKRVA